MSFKDRLKRAEQEDATLEGGAHSVAYEATNDSSKALGITMTSEDLKLIADFVEVCRKITDPNFRQIGLMCPSDEMKRLYTSMVEASEAVKGELEKCHAAIPKEVFEKVRSQIVDDVKKAQSGRTIELWLWRIFGSFSIVGWLGLCYWWMRQQSIIGNDPVEGLIAITCVVILALGMFKLGGWLKTQ